MRAGPLSVPITGGNVSLYNETEGRAIYPTPVLGMVGLLPDAASTVTRAFTSSGAAVSCWATISASSGARSSSRACLGRVQGEPPALDLAQERALQRLVVALVRARLVESAHDCSDGGLAVTLGGMHVRHRRASASR